MTPFQEINADMSQWQAALEDAIRRTIEAEEAEDKAEIELIKAQSAKKKARLEQRLYQSKVDSLKEMGYNARAESRLG